MSLLIRARLSAGLRRRMSGGDGREFSWGGGGCRGGGLIGHVIKSPLLNSYFHSPTLRGELYGVHINAQWSVNIKWNPDRNDKTEHIQRPGTPESLESAGLITSSTPPHASTRPFFLFIDILSKVEKITLIPYGSTLLPLVGCNSSCIKFIICSDCVRGVIMCVSVCTAVCVRLRDF